MCGIFAVVQTQTRWPAEALKTATEAMRHRGPDAGGYWQEDGVFLGHRRLAIIDLKTGTQPMISHDGRYVVTFNGEIYNYRELRSTLKGQGHNFHTASDTEVILEAYRHWGEDCVRHLHGMFGFVLWDRREKNLIAARDRLGIKPLCWMSLNEGLLLSSTLEPLFVLPGLSRELDYEAFRDLLVFDYIPAPRTILRKVHKLLPGHVLTWKPDQRGPIVTPYWQVPAPQGPAALPSKAELCEQVEATLDKAVQRQMVSDVPLGAFLSGGIDSSLLVAFMARHSPMPVKTFSVSFKGDGYDESPYAREVAQAFGTEHTVLPAEETDGNQLLEIIGQLDEPFADPALVPTYALSALTREHVTVALAGDGGDEVFGGYAKYLLGEDRTRNPWYPWTRPLKWLMDHCNARLQGAERVYWRTLTQKERIVFSWARYGEFPVFKKDLRLAVSSEAYSRMEAKSFFEPWQAQERQWGSKFTVDALMRTDLRTYLSENCLVKTDRASMMSSLEVRVPYLDETVLDLVVPLPGDLKISHGQLKSLILPLAQSLLPRCAWDRPKHGFGMPLGLYMGNHWQSQIFQMLAWGRAHFPLFNYSHLEHLIEINNYSHNLKHELWNPFIILSWFYKHDGQITL